MSERAGQSLQHLVPEGGILIEFPDVSPAEAGRRAKDMQAFINDSLKDASEPAAAERIRANPEALDLGPLIGIVLGAKATLEIAKGIAKWLARNNQAKVRILTRGGDEVLITNAESKDLANILKSLKL